MLTVSSSSALQNRHPKTRPEFYALLYTFGQYYLQIFPSKTAAFLEYLSFLTVYASQFHMQMLIKLDNSIRHFFVHHPNLNWDVTCPEVNCYLTNANMELARLNSASAKSKNKQQASQQNQNKGSSKCSSYGSCGDYYSAGRSGNREYSRGRAGHRDNYDPREHRCRNWNWKYCKRDPKCFCAHVCYECGDPGHQAPDCPRNYGG